MNLRSIRAVAFAAVAALTFSACAASTPAAEEVTEVVTDTVDVTDHTEAAETPAAPTGETRPVTMLMSNLVNPFFIVVRDAAQEEAARQNIDLTVLDSQDDSTTQANQVADAVTGGTHGIIINSVDNVAAAAAVRPVLEQGIPVVGVDRGVDGVDLTSMIASDNVDAGRQAGHALAEAIGGSGTVIHITGTPGTDAQRDRSEGFVEAMAEYPDIEIVATQPGNFNRAEALDVATNLLQAHPNVNGIFTENDEMMMGAITALGDRAGQDVFVTSVDGAESGLEQIQAGTLVATIAQQPVQFGVQSVQLMAKALNGEPIEEVVSIPVVTVNRDNVNEFLTN